MRERVVGSTVGVFNAADFRTAGCAQELLSHPFLRPTAAAAPATPDCLVGLTREQLKKVLTQVCPPGKHRGLCMTGSMPLTLHLFQDLKMVQRSSE
jgi:hypothetical protein